MGLGMDVVDLYAGAGGWNLGLALAGHRSVFSGEIWPTANRARAWNMGGDADRVDVRALDPLSIPNCDLLVGSPPCTQFSYANRGGNGDLVDGLRDVRAFLEAVRVKNPRYWVMENVPRLCSILERELGPGGALEEFADLFSSIDDFDMSEWGVPQRRRRCIAGNYPREALLAMRGRIRPATLGEIVRGCAEGIDPVWGTRHAAVSDNEPGELLSWEEARINAEKKTNHPIYNDMSFPDASDRPARTVTATCTKVSRESIVVPAAEGGFRLLSVRETAAIQSFPLSYQFPAEGKSDRIKMAGNAIPPLFTYLLGLAVSGREFSMPSVGFLPAAGMAAPARSRPRKSIPPRGRPFRAAIDGLRFKSAMSFELRNRFDEDGGPRWGIVLNLGKFFEDHVHLDALGIAKAASRLPNPGLALDVDEVRSMQTAWAGADDVPGHPYRIADRVGRAAVALANDIDDAAALEAVNTAFSSVGLAPTRKALGYASLIAGGLAIAARFNEIADGL